MEMEMDFLTNFYAKTHDKASFLSGLDSVLGSTNASVRIVPFFPSHPIGQLLDLKTSKFTIIPILQEKGLWKCNYTFIYVANKNKEKMEGVFYIFNHTEFSNAYFLATFEGSFFFNRGIKPLLNYWYPKIATTFLSHNMMKHLLFSFQNDNDYDELRIVRASSRQRESGGKQVSMVSWQDFSLDKAFDWIYQQDGWFKSLGLQVRRNSHVMTNISLSRQGCLKCDSFFKKFYEYFVSPVCETIHKNVELFKNRSRLDNEGLSVKPLKIDYLSEQLESKEERKRLIEAMVKLENSSVSVLHGNPYVHLSIVDYLDGSTFDFWVLDSHSIVLVPQLKASVNGIKRVINHVFDNYKEGKILDDSSERCS